MRDIQKMIAKGHCVLLKSILSDLLICCTCKQTNKKTQFYKDFSLKKKKKSIVLMCYITALPVRRGRRTMINLDGMKSNTPA